MARANPANKPQPNDAAETEQNGPIIEYFGEGATDVVFNIDPNASRIRVYATGLILVDY